jgi:hypothetical protein
MMNEDDQLRESQAITIQVIAALAAHTWRKGWGCVSSVKTGVQSAPLHGDRYRPGSVVTGALYQAPRI